MLLHPKLCREKVPLGWSVNIWVPDIRAQTSGAYSGTNLGDGRGWGNSVLISALSPLQGLPGAPGKRGKMGRPVKIFRVYYADSMVKLPTQWLRCPILLQSGLLHCSLL